MKDFSDPLDPLAPLDPLDRPLGRLLRLAHVADPQDLVGTLSMVVAEMDGGDVVLFLIDYDHSRLAPHPAVSVDGKPISVVNLEGSLAGRAFLSGRPVAVQRDGLWRIWTPITDRTERLGVLSMSLPNWNEDLEQFAVELGYAAAHLIISADRYTDLLRMLRRKESMSLPAEMQWGLLPPLTLSVATTNVACLLEPAYHIGGDCFDYAVNGSVLDFAVFDSMGHGLASAMLAALTIAAYRNGRRAPEPRDLRGLVMTMDEAVGDYGQGDSFVTALVAQLDTLTGRVRWVSAGHPAPLIVRHGSALPESGGDNGLPLGLGSALGGDAESFDVVETSLEPGDGLLLFTDGVVEARDQDGEEFGTDRLRDFVERESASGREPAETVRRLVSSVLSHQGAPLRDDASLLYLRWDGPS